MILPGGCSCSSLETMIEGKRTAIATEVGSIRHKTDFNRLDSGNNVLTLDLQGNAKYFIEGNKGAPVACLCGQLHSALINWEDQTPSYQ